MRYFETADQRDNEIFHQVPVGVVCRLVARMVDNAAGRVQHERDIRPRVPASCNVKIMEFMHALSLQTCVSGRQLSLNLLQRKNPNVLRLKNN